VSGSALFPRGDPTLEPSRIKPTAGREAGKVVRLEAQGTESITGVGGAHHQICLVFGVTISLIL
jgi:hypothetical protein